MKREKVRCYIKTIIIIAVTLLLGYVTLKILPKGIAAFLRELGIHIEAQNPNVQYGMGITVRCIGLFVTFLLVKHLYSPIKMSYKIDKVCLQLGWLFYLYILANIEFPQVNSLNAMSVLLMMVECFAIGFFEEYLFRGFFLKAYVKIWGITRKAEMEVVILSGIVFGVFHFANLKHGINDTAVFSQVLYTAMIGIAFAALALRTNWNIFWCAILHSLYNMASGFGDFVRMPVADAVRNPNIAFDELLWNVIPFIPLLLYGLFLMRKEYA